MKEDMQLNEGTWNLAISKLGISSTTENFEELVMMEIYKAEIHCFDLTRFYNSCSNLKLLEDYSKKEFISDFKLVPGEEKISRLLKKYYSLLFGDSFVIKIQEYCDNWGQTYTLPVKIYYTSDKVIEVQNMIIIGLKSKIR